MLRHPPSGSWDSFPESWFFQPQQFKGTLQMIEIKLLVHMELMAIVSSREKQPYHPFIRAKKRPF